MSDTPLMNLHWSRGYTDPAWVRRYTTSERELLPSRRVWRGPGPARSVPADIADVGRITFTTPGGRAVPLRELLEAAQTDALLVLHRGDLVYETYPHGLQPHDPHFNASAAKSYMGLMAAALIYEGALDREATASKYVPELAGTAFGDSTVDHLLHMGTQVSYGGRPFDKPVEAQRYFAVIAPSLRPYGYSGPGSIREHLATARATAAPGTEFRYENGNVETLAEILRRVTGATTSGLLSDMVWSRIGADEDAYYVLDSEGAEAACGGFSATARDVARLGEMIRCGGAVGEQQIVPSAVIADITNAPEGYARHVRFPAAPPTAPANLSYHDLWWILNDGHGSFMASGIHGQRLFISPELETVIVHYGSQVMSPAVPAAPLVPAFQQIATHLQRTR
ncbi:serine hydrolase domain-containing protein [Streptomyces sp. NPDC058257]|uniref:serine hydrolase domain-containing protein n=1 Tax=Streptomyces sp. NPDC058257 TaxID=3346409 RepID=UPI0036DFB4F1